MNKVKIHTTNPILIELPLPIVTPRLIIRPPVAGGGAELAEAIEESWNELHQWEDWAIDKKMETDVNQCEIKTRRDMARLISREALPFRCYSKQTEKFIGMTDIDHPNWETRQFVAGYWIRTSEQKKGYATEATNALLRYAFAVLSASSVGIGHACGNIASEKVVQKLGFTFIGQRPDAVVLSGERVLDDRIYVRKNIDNLPPLEVSWGI